MSPRDANFPSSPSVALAIQGGGSHGAFAWGVLDRLFETQAVPIAALSGASAGAVNAAVAAAALAEGGPDSARANLNRLWHRVAGHAVFGPFQPTWFERAVGTRDLDTSPFFAAFDLAMRMVSPYQLNPFDFNPLRQLLREVLDVKHLMSPAAPPTFVAAANVLSGRLKVFDNRSITIEALVASACLPFLFRPVEIDGVPYWDGGYVGNPTLSPLVRRTGVSDIIVIQVVPFRRAAAPTGQTAIVDRMGEISYTAAFLHEAAAIERINRLIERGHLDPAAGHRPIRLHRIEAERELAAFGASSKLNADRGFLNHLRDIGRGAVDRFLRSDAALIGIRSGFDPEAYLEAVEETVDAS